MRNLLDFIRKYSYWFLFLILEAISIVLLFRFNSYQGSVWFTSANAFTIQLEKSYTELISYLNLRSINRELTTQNIQLQRENDILREQLYHSGADSLHLSEKQLKALENYKLINATVLSNSIYKTNNYIVIDKGEEDGVQPEMGVVGGGGIVGIVYLTGPHHSLIIPLLHSKSNISCRVRNKRFFGYLKWEGNNPLYAVMTDVPRYAKLKIGETVETSGFSEVFPPGLFVGRITAINDSRDGLSYRLRVQLGTGFASLRDVCVVVNPHKAEVHSLKQQANEITTNSK